MRVSFNSIKGLVERYNCAQDLIPQDSNVLINKIGEQLGAVEEIVEFSKPLERAVVVRVVSVEKHPNADKLHICLIDDGNVNQGIERNQRGFIQVVCGAPNVRENMNAVWLPPASVVPSTYHNDKFVLESRDIRGQVSHGMLASSKELGLSDDHGGIFAIESKVKPGDLFVDAFDLRDDIVIDIENKMFTHRPDCFGMLGIARELAGIQQIPFQSPEWYKADAAIPGIESEELKLEVINEIPELVPRFTAVSMRNVNLIKSPEWLQLELAKVGIKSINVIVDLTNFFMVETGQPLHAYDYDKVMAQDEGADHATLVIRRPKPGDKLNLLGGKQIDPRQDSILIATRNKPIGLGGVMGGADTEVDADTKNIIIEVANFDMYSIRRTSMAHGLFTDAVTRFSKGQSPLQSKSVLAKMVDEVRRLTGGKVSSALIDDIHTDLPDPDYPNHRGEVNISTEFINQRLGLSLNVEEISSLLRNVEFVVAENQGTLIIKVPFWRTDIEIPEDIVEEVGRLNGYNKLPLELPSRSVKPIDPDRLIQFKTQIRNNLSRFGANEIYSYSFVHGDLLEKTGQNKESAFKVANALSPGLQYYRMSLTPNLLSLIHSNIKSGHDKFAVFEIGKVHAKGFMTKSDLPVEFERAALVVAGTNSKHEPAYYLAKKYLTELLNSLGLSESISLEPLNSSEDISTTFYTAGRSATIKVNDVVIGRIGEYKDGVRKALKLPQYCAGFELGLAPLLKLVNKSDTKYRPLSKFPPLSQDLCLQVSPEVSYAELTGHLQAALNLQLSPELKLDIEPIDIYTSEQINHQKRVTYRIRLTSYERTLTENVLTNILDKVTAELQSNIGAIRI